MFQPRDLGDVAFALERVVSALRGEEALRCGGASAFQMDSSRGDNVTPPRRSRLVYLTAARRHRAVSHQAAKDATSSSQGRLSRPIVGNPDDIIRRLRHKNIVAVASFNSFFTVNSRTAGVPRTSGHAPSRVLLRPHRGGTTSTFTQTAPGTGSEVPVPTVRHVFITTLSNSSVCITPKTKPELRSEADGFLKKLLLKPEARRVFAYSLLGRRCRDGFIAPDPSAGQVRGLMSVAGNWQMEASISPLIRGPAARRLTGFRRATECLPAPIPRAL
ncbi:hypothetical protein EYF80_014353 [Liparis tanakae]|uniref:Uncharacterized protein n=1 Tax=Liparis tanakae TaxID=230148 RepID=A0A4Z2ICU2_9TELE|nr:hypothetical protein EYF80_014353 [Liparis tanakae]